MTRENLQQAIKGSYFNICEIPHDTPERQWLQYLHCKSWDKFTDDDFLKLYSLAEAIGAVGVVREKFSSYTRATDTYVKAYLAQIAVEKVTDKNPLIIDRETLESICLQQGGRFWKFLSRIFGQPLETVRGAKNIFLNPCAC